MVEDKQNRRVCKISSNGIFVNPIWPLRLHGIIQMAITPSVFVIETYILTLRPSAWPEVLGGTRLPSISKT